MPTQHFPYKASHLMLNRKGHFAVGLDPPALMVGTREELMDPSQQRGARTMWQCPITKS